MYQNKIILIIFTDYLLYRLFKKYLILNNDKYKIKTLYINNIFNLQYNFDNNFILKDIKLKIKEFKIFNYFKEIDHIDEIFIQYDDLNYFNTLNAIFLEKYIRKNLEYNSLLFINKKFLDLNLNIDDFLSYLYQHSNVISKDDKLYFFNSYLINNIIEYYLSIQVSKITSKFLYFKFQDIELLKFLKENYSKENEVFVLEKINKKIDIDNIKYNNNNLEADLLYIYLTFLPYKENIKDLFLNNYLELLEYNILEIDNDKIGLKKELINKIDINKLLKNKRIENKLFLHVYYLLNYFKYNSIEVFKNVLEYKSLINNDILKIFYNSNENKELVEKLFLNNKTLSFILLSKIDNLNIISLNEIFKKYKNNILLKELFTNKIDYITIINFINKLKKKKLVTLKIENIQLSNKLIYLLNNLNIEKVLNQITKLKEKLEIMKDKNLLNNSNFIEVFNKRKQSLDILFNISNYSLLENVYKYIKNNNIKLKLSSNKKAFFEVYSDKQKLQNLVETLGYKELPTEKQIYLLNKIKEELNIDIPEDAFYNKTVAKKIINENINKLKEPTEKMKQTALKIIETFKLNVNKEKILSSFDECKKFLSLHL